MSPKPKPRQTASAGKDPLLVILVHDKVLGADFVIPLPSTCPYCNHPTSITNMFFFQNSLGLYCKGKRTPNQTTEYFPLPSVLTACCKGNGLDLEDAGPMSVLTGGL